MNVFAPLFVPDSMRNLRGTLVKAEDPPPESGYERRLAQMRENARKKRKAKPSKLSMLEQHGAAVRRLREAKATYPEIAAQLGIAVSTAWKIDMEMKWKR